MSQRPTVRTNDFEVPAYLEMMLGNALAAHTGKLDGNLAFSQVPYLKAKDVKRALKVDPGYGKKGEKQRLPRELEQHFNLRKGSIYLAASAMEADLVAIRALVGPGDEVICEFPTYDALMAQIQSAGAKLVKWPRRYATGFALDFDRLNDLITRRTKLIVLSNGHNPSGLLLTEEERRTLKQVAEKKGIPVLLDEVYLPASAHKRPPYSCKMSPMFISIGSLDKSYRLGPLRLGWVAADPGFIKDIAKQRLLAPTLSSVSLQMLDYFMPELESIRLSAVEISDRGKKIVDDWVNNIDGIEWIWPTSCCIGFPKIPVKGDALMERMLKRHKVLIPSGSYFGHPNHIRISYINSVANLKKNLSLITAEITALRTKPARARRIT